MLLILVLVWAALVVAVCAICAAGGVADEDTERWYSEIERGRNSPEGSDRDAA
jgi:hypothetical protein